MSGLDMPLEYLGLLSEAGALFVAFDVRVRISYSAVELYVVLMAFAQLASLVSGSAMAL